MKKLNLCLSAAIAAVVVATSFPADARVGSSSSSRSSYSSSKSSGYSSSKSSSYSSPSRAGSGSSVGISRPNAVNQARSQQYKSPPPYVAPAPRPAPAPAPAAAPRQQPSNDYRPPAAAPRDTYRDSYRDNGGYNASRNTPSYAPPSSSGAGMGTVIGAGVLGYMLGNSGDAHAAPVQPQAAPAQPQGAPVGSAAGGAVATPGNTVPAPSAPAAETRAPNGPLSSYSAGRVTEPSGPLKRTEDAAGDAVSFAMKLMGVVGLLALLILGVRYMLSNQGAPAGRNTRPASSGLPKANTMAKTSSFPASTFQPAPKAGSQDPDVVREELLHLAPSFFEKLQDANNRGDKDAIASMTDDKGLLDALIQDIETRTEPVNTQVLNLRVVGDKVLDFELTEGSFYGSIHFAAVVKEGGSDVSSFEEVWHFVRPPTGGNWKLGGIEQL